MAITTTGCIKVEDVTFKGGRSQDQVLKDLEEKYGSDPDNESGVVVAPVSLTPEQVKNYFEQKITVTANQQEKKVYAQTIRWIDEMLEIRKKLVSLELKYRDTSDADENDDI